MSSDIAQSAPSIQTSSTTNTDTMAYTNCNTCTIDLKRIEIPTDPTTPDSTLRNIYKKYTSSKSPQHELLQSAILSLTTGIAPPVAFHTETVYGLGADATNSASISGIFAAKGRPSDNPLIVHVSSIQHLERCLGGPEGKSTIPNVYKDLLSRFWPGPLTVLLPVPGPGHGGVEFAPNVHPGQKTIGFRMPSSPYARFLIAAADRPIAAPSANSSGKPSPTTAEHVKEDLNGKINFILDGGICDVGVESTVVDGLCDPPLILRPGGLSKVNLRAWGRRMNNVWQHVENGWEHKKGVKREREEPVQSDRQKRDKPNGRANGEPQVTRWAARENGHKQEEKGAILINGHDAGIETAPRAPGMKYKHYAPSGHMFLLETERDSSATNSSVPHEQARAKMIKILSQVGPSLVRTKSLKAVEITSTPSRIGILTSTSWPPFAGLDACAETGASANAPGAVKAGMELATYDSSEAVVQVRETTIGIYIKLDDVQRTNGNPAEEQKMYVVLDTIHLGREPKQIARNLFAALRKCDTLGCEYIFVEAPVRNRGGSGREEKDGGLDEDEFETVLERMRKAASEVVHV